MTVTRLSMRLTYFSRETEEQRNIFKILDHLNEIKALNRWKLVQGKKKPGTTGGEKVQAICRYKTEDYPHSIATVGLFDSAKACYTGSVRAQALPVLCRAGAVMATPAYIGILSASPQSNTIVHVLSSARCHRIVSRISQYLFNTVPQSRVPTPNLHLLGRVAEIRYTGVSRGLTNETNASVERSQRRISRWIECLGAAPTALLV